MKASFIAVVAGLLFSSIAAAGPTAQDAELLITNSANQINAIVKDAPAYIDTDPDRYYEQIAEALDPVVDFTTFARGVMGHLASKRYVESLPEGERDAARTAVPQFRDVLYHTVVKSYGKIFYNYAGSQFSIQSSELLGNGDQASVIQKVVDTQAKQYALQYTLNNKGGKGWKIQNVIVDGVNMGQSYRAQFEAALERYKGNTSDVIKNWPEIMEGHE
ncbi:MAG: ABC transporter substrate-binding protein [Halioglobus sp.]